MMGFDIVAILETVGRVAMELQFGICAEHGVWEK